jgi:hypothetical protein
MATAAEWATGYARQARADLNTFDALQLLLVPDCHKLLFLQMASEKLVKAHLCNSGSDPGTLQASHAYVAGTLPRVLHNEAAFINPNRKQAREVLRQAKHLAREIDVLAPAVRRGGQRPDNCEYPWEDQLGNLRVPLDWSFSPAQLLLRPAGIAFLRLVRSAINRLLQ